MFEVKESPLHGRGLFATTRIPEGTIIGWLKTKKAKKSKLNGPYILWVGGKKPVRVTCDLRFINHSNEPNACYYDDLSVMAVRDITPGEEILHNYMGDAAFEDGDHFEVGFENERDTIELKEAALA
ncbi:MAG: SET domain-containing protein [Planctomycetota bacterium]